MTPHRLTVVLSPPLVVLLVVLMGACQMPPADPAARLAGDPAQIGRYMDDAEAGDPHAQYRLGDAYCCGVGDPRRRDLREATYWLCEAADQGYAPAQYRLGQIYAGDVPAGAWPPRRTVTGFARRPVDHAVAAGWFALAAEQGYRDAAERAAAARRALSPVDARRASAFRGRALSIPCDWDAVFVSA
ncbi:MAG: hypothetical protein AAFV86_20675 [Pseudomonadota bacterium]